MISTPDRADPIDLCDCISRNRQAVGEFGRSCFSMPGVVEPGCLPQPPQPQKMDLSNLPAAIVGPMNQFSHVVAPVGHKKPTAQEGLGQQRLLAPRDDRRGKAAIFPRYQQRASTSNRRLESLGLAGPARPVVGSQTIGYSRCAMFQAYSFSSVRLGFFLPTFRRGALGCTTASSESAAVTASDTE